MVDADRLGVDYGLDPGEHVTCTFRLQDRSIPKAGRWKVTEVSNSQDCSPVKLKKSRPETATLKVRDRGRRLIGTGIDVAQGKRLVLDKIGEGSYRGVVMGREGAGRARTTIRWQVQTDEFVKATTTVRLRTRGVSCSITRNLEMRYRGPS